MSFFLLLLLLGLYILPSTPCLIACVFVSLFAVFEEFIIPAQRGTSITVKHISWTPKAPHLFLKFPPTEHIRSKVALFIGQLGFGLLRFE